MHYPEVKLFYSLPPAIKKNCSYNLFVKNSKTLFINGTYLVDNKSV